MAYQELDFGRSAVRRARKSQMRAQVRVSAMQGNGPLLAAALPRRWLPSLQVLLLCVVWLFMFKALLLATVGHATYAARLARLAEGNAAEAAGAWVMQPDAVTRALSVQLGKLTR